MSSTDHPLDRSAPYRGPLHIDAVTVPTGGTLGLVHCPGRCDHLWHRDISADLDAIEAWGAAMMVTLVERAELEQLGVETLPHLVADRSFRWLNLPIPDMGLPTVEAEAAFSDIHDALQRGDRVLLHCAAGLGRTGTVAASLLVDSGMAAKSAIELVRASRPGTIETAAQEAYIYDRAKALRMVPMK